MSARTHVAPDPCSSDGRAAGARLVFAFATFGGVLAGMLLERTNAFSWPPAAGFSFVTRHGVAAIATSLGFLFGLAHRSRAGQGLQVLGPVERLLFIVGLVASFGALAAALGLGKALERQYGAPAALLTLALVWAGVVALGRESAARGRTVLVLPAPEPHSAPPSEAARARSSDEAEALCAAFRELCRNLDDGGLGSSASERVERELTFQRMLAHLIRSPHTDAASALGEAVRLDSIEASQLRAQAIEQLAASPHWLHIEVLLEALPRDLPVIAAHAIDALADRLDPFHEDELAALQADRDPFVARVALAVMSRRAAT